MSAEFDIQNSGLNALVPIEITAARYAASSLAEPDLTKITPDGVVGEIVWAPSTVISVGARRIRTGTHRVYRDTVGGNTGTTPPENDPLRWFDEGPTNKWAWTDSLISTASGGSSPLTFSVDPGVASVLECFGLSNVDTVRLKVFDSPGGTLLLELSQSTEYFTDPDPHWELYFIPPPQLRSLSFSDLDIQPDSRCEITLTSDNGLPVSVGLLAFGDYVFLGLSQMGFEVSWRNYARESIDEWGNEVYIKGLKGKDLRGSAFLTTAEAVSAAQSIDQLLDSGAIYRVSQSASLEYMKTWGRLQPITIQPSSPNHAVLSVEIRGKV